MLKTAFFLLLLTVGISWYYNNSGTTEIPEIEEIYWGPGQRQPDPKDIKPYKINVPKEVINDLYERLDKTRPLVPPLEGAAWTYGIPSTYLKTIVDYWRNKYNWSQRQTLLNKYPQFMTKIQGLDIHFYHIKPQLPKDRQVKVLPMLLLHGWPGSIVEFQKIIPMLSTPRPDKDFVFELIVPSLPGYGFSSAAVRPGLSEIQMAPIFKNLMARLGIDKFYVQGGDWGSAIATNIAALYPDRIIGTHLNMAFVNTKWTFLMQLVGSVFPSLVVEEKHREKMYPMSYHFFRLVEESGYMHIQSSKPDTVGIGVSDSPAALAGYILEKFSTWTNPEYRFREDGGLLEKYTMDELLDNVMVYWVTNSITTSFRLYAESMNKATRGHVVAKLPIIGPVGVAMFPHELLYMPESLVQERFKNIIQFSHPARGGHFAAFEEPELLSKDVWSFVDKREQILKEELAEHKRKLAEKKEGKKKAQAV